MKRVICLLYMLTIGILSFGQDSAHHKNPPSLPQGQYGTPREGEPNAQIRKEERVQVENDKLPAKLRKTLSEGKQYEGWEDAKIYLDKSINVYLLHLEHDSGTRTYQFDENGKLISGDVPLGK